MRSFTAAASPSFHLHSSFILGRRSQHHTSIIRQYLNAEVNHSSPDYYQIQAT
jgi:hypothetical protein